MIRLYSGADGRNSSMEMWILLPLLPEIAIGTEIVTVRATGNTWPALLFEPLSVRHADEGVLVVYFGESSEAIVARETASPLVLGQACSQWGKVYICLSAGYVLCHVENCGKLCLG